MSPLNLYEDPRPEGRWVDYAPDVQIKVRTLTKETQAGFRKAAETGRHAAGAPEREVDAQKLEDLTIDYLIEDWKGVQGVGSREIYPTLEAKKALMRIPEAAEFIWKASRPELVPEDDAA